MFRPFMHSHDELTRTPFFQRLCAFPFVERVALYGSRARGDADEWSDYDLAITCPEATLEEWHRIVHLLEDAPFLVHLEAVRYDTLQEGLFKQQIDKYHRVLYAKN